MCEISMQESDEQVIEHRKVAENSLVTVALAGCVEGRAKQDFSEPGLAVVSNDIANNALPSFI